MLRLSNNSRCRQQRRQGVVLLMVLVVVVLLSLAAYNYSDLMLAEYKAADNYHKTAQARAFADSGIQYALALLSSSDNLTSMLNDNPYDNSQVFSKHAVTQGSDKTGYFTLLAPLDPDSAASTGTCRFGMIDESAKININAFMKSDPTGDKLYNMLLKLPNMTADIANSIIDWVDADTTPRQGGAENDYYAGLTPPYRCKNGPLDSIEELLLVKGVTPQLLFGSDLNRNGIQDPGEINDGSSSATGFDRGWSAYLTIYSREQNVDAQGLASTDLNDNTTVDLPTMVDTLSTKLGDDLAKFIILYRQYGPSSASGAQQALTQPVPALVVPGPGAPDASKTQTGKLSALTLDLTKKANQKIASLYDLINAQVTIPSKDPKKPATLYKSPLGDPAQQGDLLPKLFGAFTIFTGSEIPARINVNTASSAVLAALPGLAEADVQAIVAARPTYSSGDSPGPQFATPAWLISAANIKPDTLSKVEKFITARTQVYRIQALGYSEPNKGPVARVEAIIDTNGGSPRLLSWRDMADFGKVRPPQP